MSSDPSATGIELRSISAAEVRPLRQVVLRPNQHPDELIYGGDDEPGTLHAGAYRDGALVGIATISHQPPPNAADVGGWRIRGMAVLPELRGLRIGERLLAACVEHARERGGTVIWCNARTGALRFYERNGFKTVGDEFEIDGIGPHYVMERVLG